MSLSFSMTSNLVSVIGHGDELDGVGQPKMTIALPLGVARATTVEILGIVVA